MYPPKTPHMPIRKSPEAMKAYLKYGPIFGEILYRLYGMVKKGEWHELEDYFKAQCYEAFPSNPHAFALEPRVVFPFENQVNYLNEPFGHAICVSINDEVAHGRPDRRPIKSGDIVSVDCGLGLLLDDGHRINFDSAFTVTATGEDNWVHTPHEALKDIVSKQPGDTLTIAKIIRETAKEYNMKQVVSLTGHGIGHTLHESPTIHNAPAEFRPVELFEGLCFCAEPIFVDPGCSNDGSFISPTYIGEDGWVVATNSGDPASHFETTFGIVQGQIVDLVGVTNWKL